MLVVDGRLGEGRVLDLGHEERLPGADDAGEAVLHARAPSPSPPQVGDDRALLRVTVRDRHLVELSVVPTR